MEVGKTSEKGDCGRRLAACPPHSRGNDSNFKAGGARSSQLTGAMTILFFRHAVLPKNETAAPQLYFREKAQCQMTDTMPETTKNRP
jgi:hypothetical protein